MSSQEEINTEIKDIKIEILKLDRESLWNLSPERLENKLTLNRMSMGLGKTHYTLKCISYWVKGKSKKLAVIMDSHDHIREFLRDYEDFLKEIDIVHLKGRDQPNMCKLDIKDRIKTKCGECNRRKECKYLENRRNAHKCDVIFTVKQMLFLIDFLYKTKIFLKDKYDPIVQFYVKKGIDVLIIDESLISSYMESIDIRESIFPQLQHRNIECNDCNAQCDDRRKRLKRLSKYNDCNVRLLVNTKNIDFEIETLNDYYLKDNLNNSDQVYLKWDYYKKKWVFVGHKDLSFLSDFPTIIYNDATASQELIEQMIKRKIDVILEDDFEFKNPIVMLMHQMTIKKTRSALKYLLDWLRLMRIPLTKETVIICKLKFEKRVQMLTENKVMTTHYKGLSTGSNKFKDCRTVVIFGRFDYPKSIKAIYNMIGVSTMEIHKHINSNEEQAIGRIRPKLNPNKRVICLSDTLEREFRNNNEFIPLTLTHLKVCIRMINNKNDYKDLMKTQIYKKFKGKHSSNYVSYALELLCYFRWINILNKRGEKLKWKM